LPVELAVTTVAVVIVGAVALALTTTVVEPGSDGQPLTLTITEYTPAFAVVAAGIDGSRCADVKPFGPVHEYVAPVTGGVESAIVAPAQYEPPFVASGVAGAAVTLTVVAVDVALQPFASVTRTVKVPLDVTSIDDVVALFDQR
jgi:hypothetical protein